MHTTSCLLRITRSGILGSDTEKREKGKMIAHVEIPGRIEEGGMGGFTFNGNKILVVKYKGEYYAIDAKCPHKGGDLSQGKPAGKYVTCPRHARETDITTGIQLGIAGLPFLKKASKRVKVYEVITEGQKVKIDL